MLCAHLLGFQAINSQEWGEISVAICQVCTGLCGISKSYKEKKKETTGEKVCGGHMVLPRMIQWMFKQRNRDNRRQKDIHTVAAHFRGS